MPATSLLTLLTVLYLANKYNRLGDNTPDLQTFIVIYDKPTLFE
ncbi:hypothetical protein [Moraxella bovis]|nr:hypothetical protein [Moraxella bovis]